jgi:hypothetical protein
MKVPQKIFNVRILLIVLLVFLLFGLQVANALAASGATARLGQFIGSAGECRFMGRPPIYFI